MFSPARLTRRLAPSCLIALSALLISCVGTGEKTDRAAWPRSLDNFDRKLAAQRAAIERERARDPEASTVDERSENNATDETAGIATTLGYTHETRAGSLNPAGNNRAIPEIPPDTASNPIYPYNSNISLGTMYRLGYTERPGIHGRAHLGLHHLPPHHLRRGIQPHPLYSTGHRLGRVYPHRTRGFRFYYDYGSGYIGRRPGYDYESLNNTYPYDALYTTPGTRYHLPSYRLRHQLLDRYLDLERWKLRNQQLDRPERLKRPDPFERPERLQRLRPHERVRERMLQRRRPGKDIDINPQRFRSNRPNNLRPVPRHDKLHTAPEPVGPQEPSWRTGSESGSR